MAATGWASEELRIIADTIKEESISSLLPWILTAEPGAVVEYIPPRREPSPWWVKRTNEMLDAGASLTLTPRRDGSWWYRATVQGTSRYFGPVLCEAEIASKMWDARVWVNSLVREGR